MCIWGIYVGSLVRRTGTECNGPAGERAEDHKAKGVLSTGLGNPQVSMKHGLSAGDRATETHFLPPSKFTVPDPGSRNPLVPNSGLD